MSNDPELHRFNKIWEKVSVKLLRGIKGIPAELDDNADMWFAVIYNDAIYAMLPSNNAAHAFKRNLVMNLMNNPDIIF